MNDTKLLDGSMFNQVTFDSFLCTHQKQQLCPNPDHLLHISLAFHPLSWSYHQHIIEVFAVHKPVHREARMPRQTKAFMICGSIDERDPLHFSLCLPSATAATVPENSRILSVTLAPHENSVFSIVRLHLVCIWWLYASLLTLMSP